MSKEFVAICDTNNVCWLIVDVVMKRKLYSPQAKYVIGLKT